MELFDPETVRTRYGLSPYRQMPAERSFAWVGELFSWTAHHYPEAPVLARAVFAALVAGYTTGLFGGYGTDEEPLHQAADAFIQALAGWLPPAPDDDLPFSYGPGWRRLSPEETTAILTMVEVFLFVDPGVALGRALHAADHLDPPEAMRRREALARVRAYLAANPPDISP